MHPGTPCVFYDHFWDQGSLGQAVRKLLKVRRTNGIHARSKVRRLSVVAMTSLQQAMRLSNNMLIGCRCSTGAMGRERRVCSW